MSGRASLCWVCVLAMAAAVAGAPGASFASPTESAGAAVISMEDLQDAFDRGDLSQWEFDLLAELVGSRERADSVEAEQIAKRLARAPGGESAPPAAPHGSLTYSIYAPLRGQSAAGQELQFAPALGAISARILARRQLSTPWAVTEARAEFGRGALFVQAGSLTPVWTGGLLLGRAPVLAGEPAPGLRGLWAPSRARLRGVLARIATSRMESEVFGSSLAGSTWLHQVAGIRFRVLSKSSWLEPALLGQTLHRLTPAGLYQSVAAGFSAGLRRGQASVQIQSAVVSGASAVQAQASGRNPATRWQVEYWHISPAYRNPLLQARGEADREPVFYPSLDTSLLSASTGESGGRITIRTGGSRRFGEASGTVWREHPQRPAGVRLEFTAATSRGRGRLRLDYLHLLRPGLQEFSRRHEATLRAGLGNLWTETRGQWAQSSPTALPKIGGHAAAGFQIRSVRLGLWEAGVAWDAYDLSLASGQFVTLRVHHSLPLGRTQLDWHVRWRSAYASHAAALSLRVNSSVYI